MTRAAAVDSVPYRPRRHNRAGRPGFREAVNGTRECGKWKARGTPGIPRKPEQYAGMQENRNAARDADTGCLESREKIRYTVAVSL